MSWLFGGYNKGGEGGIPPGFPPPPGTGGGAGGKPPDSSDKSKMEAYRFDSAALERAAEAAKTLEKSSKCMTYTNNSPLFKTMLKPFHYIHLAGAELVYNSILNITMCFIMSRSRIIMVQNRRKIHIVFTPTNSLIPSAVLTSLEASRVNLPKFGL